MKRTLIFVSLLLVGAVQIQGQISGFSGEEPEQSELGAPLFPGSVFIRIYSSLDPYHETAMYVTLDPLKTVEIFFEKKLPEKRKVYYQDENNYMTVFPLKTWSTFSGKPSKKELEKLEKEPNIQIRDYDRGLNTSLVEFYEKKPDNELDFICLIY